MTVAASGQPARVENPALLPGVHRIAILAERWLLGTHQGAVDASHLPATSTSLCSSSTADFHVSVGRLFYRLWEVGVTHDPVRSQDLTRKKSPWVMRLTPPANRRHPPSLDRPRQSRPWRRSDSG